MLGVSKARGAWARFRAVGFRIFGLRGLGFRVVGFRIFGLSEGPSRV